jgi:hypothetical protein
VSAPGPAYARFRSALASGNLDHIRRAAAALPSVSLDDALRICVAYRDEWALYERAAVRWLGRFCLERKNATLEEILQAGEALERLPTSPAEATAELESLLSRG